MNDPRITEDGTFPSIDAIWRLEESNSVCCSCGHNIGTSAPVRTYQVDTAAAQVAGHPGTLSLKVGRRVLGLFTRHFDCLLSANTHFITISHVWDWRISCLQAKGAEQIDDGSEEAIYARRLIFNEAVALFDGVRRGMVDTSFEVWLDYLSIPQWNPEAKVKNLLKIPDIMSQSFCTVVCWHDVQPWAVREIRQSNGEPTLQLIKAITSICNAVWFRRMWTTIEYVQSRRVRVMLQGHHLCDDSDDLFQVRIDKLWANALVRLGDAIQLETLADLHRNLVPWQVRGLDSMRRSKGSDFALAYQRIALKGFAVPTDFYYALGGLVGSRQRLHSDVMEARWQIIQTCMENQDYSPILMPSISTNCEQRFFFGFNDLRSWGLGVRVSDAKHRLSVRGRKAVFQAQPVGRILSAEPDFWEQTPTDPAMHLEVPARFVMGCLGANLERFVHGLCLRIMGLNPYAVMRRVLRQGRRDAVQGLLDQMRRSTTSWPKSAMDELIHLLNLDDASLYLDDTPGDMNELPSYWKSWIDDTPDSSSPISMFLQNGTSLHLSDQSGFVSMICPSCNSAVTTRAGLYKSPAEIEGAIGFRIPGLQYDRSLPDGIGIIVKDAEIVGRFLYCCPCCPGPPTVEIELDLPAFPLPLYNPTVYVENDVVNQQ